MRICVAGAGGYVGLRLCRQLLQAGHDVLAITRSKSARLQQIQEEFASKAHCAILLCDLTQEVPQLKNIEQPTDELIATFGQIDHLYYLIHSMTGNYPHFEREERLCIHHLRPLIQEVQIKHLIYLGALCEETTETSRHFRSRQAVAKGFQEMQEVKTTLLRASIIIGSGSSSFQIMHDLVRKLPIMVAPKWIAQLCQPVGIADLLFALIALLDQPSLHGESYDLCGHEVTSFQKLLEEIGQKMKKRSPRILVVPLLTPRLSSLWLYFVTKVDFSLARALVDSMCYPSISRSENLFTLLGHLPLALEESVARAMEETREGRVLSSWSDHWRAPPMGSEWQRYSEPKREGAYIEKQSCTLSAHESHLVLKRLWEIGGRNGWYAFDHLWRLRGWIDLLFGGVGYKRGRRARGELMAGDSLDWWRVIEAEKELLTSPEGVTYMRGKLLLFAEMRLPGVAWLMFRIEKSKEEEESLFEVEAIFRPSNLWGKLYWILLIPMHKILFRRMMLSLKSKTP